MKHSSHIAGLIIAALFGVFCLIVGLESRGEAGGLSPRTTRVLNIPQGRSALLHFQHMRRVQVVEPEIVEAVVASFNDLSLYGRKAGDTVVYVWDKLGLHEIAVSVRALSAAALLAEELAELLGRKLSYRAAGERTLIVEGTLPAAEAQRAQEILNAAAREGVQIVNLVRSESEEGTGAAAALAAQLAKILGEELEYIVWNSDTLIVRGALGDQQKLAQARQLLGAVGNQRVKVVELLEYNPEAARPPVARLQEALGPEFRVWQITGNTVAVEGTVPTAEKLEDLQKILEAFSKEAQIVNLVRVGKPDINAAAAALQELLGGRLSVRPREGQLLIVEGTVPNEAELLRVRELLSRYPVGYKLVDLLRVALPERRQVSVQVRVVDVNKSALSRLGVNWGQISGTSFSDQPWLMQVLGPAGAGITEGNVLPVGAQLNLLQQNNLARILAEPNLLVDEGGQARMQVGGEIPVPVVQSAGTGGTAGTGGGAVTIEWKPYGVLLTIEPTILESGDKIHIKVEPEVSSLDFSNAVTLSGFVLPAIRQRKASTVVTMPDGGTLVLAGLIQSEDSKALRKIPVLGDLPIIGELFKRREFQKGESELVIMITPRIIREGEAAPSSAP